MVTLEECYNILMEKPLQILEIFNDFFGEDRVDMQGFPTLKQLEESIPNLSCDSMIEALNKIPNRDTFILVRFPQVRITNEHDKYVDIKELYAKILIDRAGLMRDGFALNRANYSLLHMSNNYMHSHVSAIPFDNFTHFLKPCTGTGPINNTIYSLSSEFDEDLWKLFCLELDKYVHVESIAGTPYHMLEGLIPGGNTSGYLTTLSTGYIMGSTISRSVFSESAISLFTKHLIDNNIIKFNFVEGKYSLAMDPVRFLLRVSNAFIDWVNENQDIPELNNYNRLEDFIDFGLLSNYIYSNGKLYRPGRNSPERFRTFVGVRICTFKGKDVCISIDDLPTNINNTILILQPELAFYILTLLTNVLNYRYGNKRDESDEESSYIDEGVLYL